MNKMDESTPKRFETVIGLEVHVQLNTKSKLFSSAPSKFGASPNQYTSYVDAALPGTLPVVNEEAIVKAIQFGLAIGATIHQNSYFERKNYFYPDLPKGYQISQYQNPILTNGHIDIESPDGQTKRIIIERAHLEEDAGKSVHLQKRGSSGIDLNRAGTALLEIVTTPCMHSAEEAVLYLKALHELVRFLDLSDGNMQEGSFRCDVNLSVRPKGTTALGIRTELKNINSFRFIEDAIRYEESRHIDCIERGESLMVETRQYLPKAQKTEHMRFKETNNDYRYFKDPDLLPIHISPELMDKAKHTLMPTPSEIKSTLETTYTLDRDEIAFLFTSKAHLDYFQSTMAGLKTDDAKEAVKWMRGLLSAKLNEHQQKIDDAPVPPVVLAKLLVALRDQHINAHQAKQLFHALWALEAPFEHLIDKIRANQGEREELKALIHTILSANPEQVREFKEGKEKLWGFFVGQVMRAARGKFSPDEVNTELKAQLHE